MHWRDMWPYARNWWGASIGLLSIALAIYYGCRKMLETFDWYMDRFFDCRVRDVLEASVTKEQLTTHGPKRWALPKSVAEISQSTGMSQWRVRGSLRRLTKKKVALQDGDDWKILV